MDTHKKSVFAVDDEPLLLALSGHVLAELATPFRTFDTPAAALTAFQASSPKPDLLITDFAMPGMTGVELATACKALHPPLRILLLSGTVDESILPTSPVPIDQFIRKPCHSDALKSAIATLLSRT